jgi:hypothetical protein
MAGSVSRVTTTGAVGGGDLAAAAAIVADKARELAGAWSRKVPPSITVSVSGKVATITADAPDAYPAEMRAKHPLFGDREHWYGPPGEKFLAPAADAAAGKAMARYAQKIDKMARRAGFS